MLGLSAGLGAVYFKNSAQNAELTKLRAESKELEQLRTDVTAAQEKSQVPEGQVLISQKDKEELLRLRGEVSKLRIDNQKLSADLAALQNRAAAARAQADDAVHQAETAKAQANAMVLANRDSQRNACINNLRQFEAAKQQWAADNNKTANAVPTAADLAPYLKNNVIPTCPAGGVYTINAVGQVVTCSAPGHTLQ